MKIIGVDLGTTNSCVYYLNDEGKPTLVMDQNRHKIIPSVVWSAGPGKEIIVGNKAKVRMGQQPPPVVAAKRKMGTNETVSLGGEQVSPVQVSAHILSYVKTLVEEKTGDTVGGAIVTMPAYFDVAPRKDTYRAAVEAFFNGDEDAANGRLELQLEPEAAAFAYTIEDPAERLRVLVYDLGGGTFDVTILEKSPELGLTVLKFGGDPHLGGDNVDDRIATWILYMLRGGNPEVLDRIFSDRYTPEKQHTILQQILTNDVEGLRGELAAQDRDLLIGTAPPFDLDLDTRNPEDLARVHKLKALAEQAKMDLTTSTEALIARQGAFEDHQGETVDIDLTLSRADFNRLIGDMVSRTIEETSRVIRESGLKPEQIDRILLVGGSSRMPVIHEELQKVFDQPIQAADQDLIVARGAALRALSLNPPPPGDSRIAVEYPRQTSDKRVNIKGTVNQALPGYTVYISRDGEELKQAPVNEDRFLLTGVPLLPESENSFCIEVVDEEENTFAQTDITIRHDPKDPGSQGRISTKLAKPIRCEGRRGFKTIFAEGETLPAEAKDTCRRATQDDSIVIPFYEGERWLEDLWITGIDPSLPIGSAIDLQITMTKDYKVSAIATVRSTNQSATVDFSITHIDIPSPEVMDRDMDDVLDQIDNDLSLIDDPNLRAKFSRRVRRLEADYKKARRELTPDLHHLFTLIGELKKVLIEVRGSQSFLEPPFEVFERIVNIARGLAHELTETSPIPKTDALERISALARVGKDVWEREDAGEWKAIYADLERLKEDIESALRPPPSQQQREIPPEVIQSEMLRWLAGLSERVAEHNLEGRFGDEISQLESAARHVDLRDGDEARSALIQIVQEQLRPLDNRIDRAIRETGEDPDKNKKPLPDW